MNVTFLHLFNSFYKAKQPSWREFEHFILFLSEQFTAYNNSGFLEPAVEREYFPGMRTLVMKLMIQMSKVC